MRYLKFVDGILKSNVSILDQIHNCLWINVIKILACRTDLDNQKYYFDL